MPTPLASFRFTGQAEGVDGIVLRDSTVMTVQFSKQTGDWNMKGVCLVTELKMPMYPEDIQKVLPHRYPFLLLDRVTSIVPGKHAVGYKLVTMNEPQFTGHFPEYALMPGVLIIEAMAQLGGIAVLALPELAGKRPMFAGIDGARFRGQVRPGDKLDMEVTIDRLRGVMGRGQAVAKVDDKVVCEATVMFALA